MSNLQPFEFESMIEEPNQKGLSNVKFHCIVPFKKYEPRREKTGFLHMRKQRRRSASR